MKTLSLILCFLIACCISSGAYSAKQVQELKRAGQENEIPLLKNRFRIDDKIDEISLLFFREEGTPSVILVRPDGVKYFAISALRDTSLDWYDELSYDLVVIRNPMPGPWQVIGKIMPKSKIMVVGELSLQADPLPEMLFKGETLKITGQILNGGKPIESGFFKDVVTLNVSFVSTNNKDFANFGTGIVQVAEFKDDGYDLDETANDGIYTGEFSLNFPAGQWRPELYITTELLQRRIVQEPIIIHEPPFTFTDTLTQDEGGEHSIKIEIDDALLIPETVIMQGKIYYPNNEEQSFIINAKEGVTRQLAVQDFGWGRYNIEFSVFGSTVSGREFVATLPTHVFKIDRPIQRVPEIAPPSIDIEEVKPTEVEKPEAMPMFVVISLIVVGNISILLIGWVCIRVFVQNKPIKFNLNIPFLKKKKASEEEKVKTDKPLKSENGSKNDKTGEILNLSMKDD